MTVLAQYAFAAATGGMRPSKAAISTALLEPIVKSIAVGSVALNHELRERTGEMDLKEALRSSPTKITFDGSTPSETLFPHWLRFTTNPDQIALNQYEAPLVGTPLCAVTVHGKWTVAAAAFIVAVKDDGHVTATMRDVSMNLLPPQEFTRGHIVKVSNVFGDWAKINFGAETVLRAQYRMDDVFASLRETLPALSAAGRHTPQLTAQ